MKQGELRTSKTLNYEYNKKKEEILLNQTEFSSEELTAMLRKYHKSIALV